jgi:hypothetical protein
VDRDLIVEGHYSKVTIAKLWHARPESKAIVVLALDADGILDHPDAPVARK